MSKILIDELKRVRSILSAVTGFEDDDQEYVEDARRSVDQIIEAMLAEQPAQQEPCGWQFFQDGKWHNGMKNNDHHRELMKAAGVPVRDVCPSPQAQPAPVQQEPAGWRPATFHRDNLTFNPGLPDEQTVKFWKLQGVEIEYCYTIPQPAQQEPFGYFKAETFGWTDCAETDEGAVALYTTPQAQPAREPLTDDELADLWYKQSLDWMEFSRAIEAAHGIKENT